MEEKRKLRRKAIECEFLVLYFRTIIQNDIVKQYYDLLPRPSSMLELRAHDDGR